MRRGVKTPLTHIQAALAFLPIAHNEAMSTASALHANLIIVQRDKLLINFLHKINKILEAEQAIINSLLISDEGGSSQMPVRQNTAPTSPSNI